MRVLIVDDEAAARTRLAFMLEELDVEMVGEAANGLEALSMAAERSPDLILLDISMPEVDGFDVAQRLPEPRPMIVFQTAYDQFALEAFDHEAVDYLVKPVTLDRLERAVERARSRVVSTTPFDEVITRLRASFPTPPPQTSRILARHRNAHILVPRDEIIQFRAEGGVVYARTAEREFLTDYTLAELEGRMGSSFLRPNRSELVNVDAIRSITSNGDGSATVTLKDDSPIRVSRRRASEVRSQLDA